MRRVAVLLATMTLATMTLAVVLASEAAQAIINGQPDANRHPYVGMVYSDEGAGARVPSSRPPWS
jgi:hypothetical protein